MNQKTKPWILLDERGTVRHEHSEMEIGLDLTRFESAEVFISLLRRNGLDPNNDFLSFHCADGWYTYVWSKEDILIVTGNNPITGRHNQPEWREDDKGYASYVGIEGRADHVRAFYDDVMETAQSVKGQSLSDRRFI